MTCLPFAQSVADLNAEVGGMLANATATHQGGAPFGVLFDRAAADLFGNGAVDAATCTAAFCLANAPGLVEGGELVIDGEPYIVASGVQPDAGGWVSLAVYPKD